MLFVFTGTDREKARGEMNKAIAKHGKKKSIVRVTDANTVADLNAALQGGGMFDTGARVTVFESTLANPEMREIVLTALPKMRESDEHFFIFEEKPDAATRKQIEKYAEESKKFDAVKTAERDGGIFTLASALRKGDKKALWIGYQRELGKSAPEAIHGVLFWGAKQMALSARGESEKKRAYKIVADLAELPHASRRRGEELEYALERFVLTIA
jgi:hypothetical protein